MLRSVRILGQRVSVRLVEHLQNPNLVADHDDHEVLGAWTSMHSLIRLNSNMAPERMRITFMHENIHALMDAGGIDTQLASINDDLEEELVGRLAPLFVSWLRENPAAVTYIRETT